MHTAKITGEGLACIAILVAMLWGCILVERSIVRDSRRQTARLLLDLRKMKNGGKSVPVSHPQGFPVNTRPVVG